ncbi:MAG: hypothetical protein AAF938_04365 [Myxococcota bacterium]
MKSFAQPLQVGAMLALITLLLSAGCSDADPGACACTDMVEGAEITAACGTDLCLGGGLRCIDGAFVANPGACAMDGGIASSDTGVPSTDMSVEPPADARVPEPDAAMPDMACVPQCSGRACGGDGCGGFCGSCAGGQRCVSGRCESTCPPFSSPDGDGCRCNAGFTLGPACDSCIRDGDDDGCWANASRSGDSCVCNEGFRLQGCECVSVCAAGERFACGECVAFTRGCPAGTTRDGDRCECDGGGVWDPEACICTAEFTDPAFEPSACTGPPMTQDEALGRLGPLGTYTMVFRRRVCEDGSGGICGPWRPIPNSLIPWLRVASGVLDLDRSSGSASASLDIQAGICESTDVLSTARYLHGARCSGVGTPSISCPPYALPAPCNGGFDPVNYRLPVDDEFLRPTARTRFEGVLTSTCARLTYATEGLRLNDEGTDIEYFQEEVGIFREF